MKGAFVLEGVAGGLREEEQRMPGPHPCVLLPNVLSILVPRDTPTTDKPPRVIRDLVPLSYSTKKSPPSFWLESSLLQPGSHSQNLDGRSFASVFFIPKFYLNRHLPIPK